MHKFLTLQDINLHNSTRDDSLAYIMMALQRQIVVISPSPPSTNFLYFKIVKVPPRFSLTPSPHVLNISYSYFGHFLNPSEIHSKNLTKLNTILVSYFTNTDNFQYGYI